MASPATTAAVRTARLSSSRPSLHAQTGSSTPKTTNPDVISARVGAPSRASWLIASDSGSYSSVVSPPTTHAPMKARGAAIPHAAAAVRGRGMPAASHGVLVVAGPRALGRPGARPGAERSAAGRT